MSFKETSIMVQATPSGSTSAFILWRHIGASQYACCGTDLDAKRHFQQHVGGGKNVLTYLELKWRQPQWFPPKKQLVTALEPHTKLLYGIGTSTRDSGP